jgi:hypothetical protein
MYVSSSFNGPIGSSTQLYALTAMTSTNTYFSSFIFQWICGGTLPASNPRKAKRSLPKHHSGLVGRHGRIKNTPYFLMDALAFKTTGGGRHANTHHPTTRESSPISTRQSKPRSITVK